MWRNGLWQGWSRPETIFLIEPPISAEGHREKDAIPETLHLLTLGN